MLTAESRCWECGWQGKILTMLLLVWKFSWQNVKIQGKKMKYNKTKSVDYM